MPNISQPRPSNYNSSQGTHNTQSFQHVKRAHAHSANASIARLYKFGGALDSQTTDSQWFDRLVTEPTEPNGRAEHGHLLGEDPRPRETAENCCCASCAESGRRYVELSTEVELLRDRLAVIEASLSQQKEVRKGSRSRKRRRCDSLESVPSSEPGEPTYVPPDVQYVGKHFSEHAT